MGIVRIQVEGSFLELEKVAEEYSAEVGGHANALGRAIRRLAGLLPGAIALDHQLHGEGDKPPRGDWGFVP